MFTAGESALLSKRTGSINLFLLHIFHIQNSHKAETCEVFQDEKYFSMNAQPHSTPCVTQVTHKVTFTPYVASCIDYRQISSLSSNDITVCEIWFMDEIRHTFLTASIIRAIKAMEAVNKFETSFYMAQHHIRQSLSY
jgi:hypothetical protein